MIAEAVHILPTEKSPEVYLNPEGTIHIRGRGLIVNKTEITDQILDWIELYLNDPAEVTYVIVAFEYLNSFSTSALFSVLKKISQVMLQSKKLIIKWYYEEDDADILERGEYIAASLQMPMEFIISHKEAEY
jgi:hypothetical protein